MVAASTHADDHWGFPLAARDAYGTMVAGEQRISNFGVRTILTSRNPDEDIQDTVVGGMAPQGARIDAWGTSIRRVHL